MTYKQAIAYFGSQSGLARALGISPSAVCQWQRSGEIPMLRQFELEEVTNGDLRVAKRRDRK